MINKIQNEIEEYLISQKIADKIAPRNLFEPIDYTLEAGGKRLRPLLALLSAYLFEDDYKKALSQAIGLEVFHNFTLLHDDLMDSSETRRGRASVYKKWNENIAILSGDAMSIMAYQYIADIVRIDRLKEVLDIFSTMALDVCRGQQFDMDFENMMPTKENYLEMIRLKTAVLIGASMQIGAIAAGASKEDALTLYKIGESFGLLFQIQDDILDIYSDEKTLGKPIGGDVLNAKKTIIFLKALELSQSNKEDNDILLKSLSEARENPDYYISAIRNIYDKYGIKKYASDLMASYKDEAMKLFNILDIPEHRKKPMIELFEKLLNRNK